MSRGGGYTGGTTSSYTGSSSFASGSSWTGSTGYSSSTSSFSGSDIPLASSSSHSSCQLTCQLGLGISFGIFFFICGGYLVVYAIGSVMLRMVLLIYQWVNETGKWLRGGLKKVSQRFEGSVLIHVRYRYGVRDQARNDGSNGSDITLDKGTSLWACVCRLALRPLYFLGNIRAPRVKETDVEKNTIEPVSRRRIPLHTFVYLKKHPPHILPAVWPHQKSLLSESKIGKELVPTIVSLSSLKEGFMWSFDSVDKEEIKERSIDPDRTQTESPSMGRRLRSFVSSLSSPPRLPSHERDPKRAFEEGPENYQKKGISPSASSSTMMGLENKMSSEMGILKSPEPVYVKPTIKR